MNNFREKLIDGTLGIGEKLRLVKREVVLTIDDIPNTDELPAYNRIDNGQKHEVLNSAEHLLNEANPYLEQVPVTAQQNGYDTVA